MNTDENTRPLLNTDDPNKKKYGGNSRSVAQLPPVNEGHSYSSMDSTLLESDSHSQPELQDESNGGLLCDPLRPYHKFIALIFICFVSFGSYFCYDNPAALEDIMLSDLHITNSEYGNFYALYSWPNVILSFIGGFLIDRVFGVRLGAIIFATFIMVGQILFAMGAYVNNTGLLYTARFVYGIGGESLAVAGNTYAVKWFQGSLLNMVFGLQLSISRVGSTINMNVMRPLYFSLPEMNPSYLRLGTALLIAVSTCVFSMFCCFAIAYLDKRNDKIKEAAEQKSRGNNNDPEDTPQKISLLDVKDFSLALWLICIICVFYYVTVFPFVSFGLVFFIRKYDYGPSTASVVNSLLYILSAVASPIAGFCIDRTGKNIIWIMFGIILTLACHAFLAFSFVAPLAIIVIFGISYSILASALWPLVAMVVPRHQLSTAYGVMQSIQNLGLAVVAVVAGKIVDIKGYLVLEVFYLICLCVALMSTIGLYFYDVVYQKGLNLSSAARKAASEELAKDQLKPSDDQISTSNAASDQVVRSRGNRKTNEDQDEVGFVVQSVTLSAMV